MMAKDLPGCYAFLSARKFRDFLPVLGDVLGKSHSIAGEKAEEPAD